MSTVRVAGCDLGKATGRFAILAVRGGDVAIERVDEVVHEGAPLEAFRSWYREHGRGIDALGATGLHATELCEPAMAGLPEDACLEGALRFVPEADGAVNVVSIGARGYGVLVRDASGRCQYLENDKCSSGTGETMVKIAGRFGLSIQEAEALAREAASAIPITARCSVFAKSEMTHFGNQGKAADALFRGYFGSVANYVAALLARVRVDGPVLAIGGGARIGALVDALSETLGTEVVVPRNAGSLEALGAALLAAEQARAGRVAPPPSDPDELVEEQRRRFRALEPARRFADRVTRLEAAPPEPGADREPTILGLDLGSTGSKAVLTSIATGEPVLDLYDRTRGNPVDAAQRLIAALLERTDPDVRAVGLTGSGREAAATVLRACFPEAADRIVVKNEIVAHATAAIRCDPDRGRSLSVVEIGGQDAKFVQIAGGQIVESDMNKACSAGTGSFLEEQAIFYGIEDIDEFVDLAQRAERPPELGQMCTVFVAEAAATAHADGYSIADLFGGFQYSVIHNYINRVMGQRTFGDTVFFQGKPASGPALAWTLAAVAGRPVVVPPNPGAMGAWGIGLGILEVLERETLSTMPGVALDRALSARVVRRTEFQCRDRRCATLCRIEKTAVSVGEARHNVLSGGACPKYEVAGATSDKLPAEAPSAFDERDALLAPYLADASGPRTVGLPVVGALHGYLPWAHTLLSELGLGVRVLRSGPGAMARGEERCFSFDACAPVKVAHGVADADLDTLFFPKLLALGTGRGGKTCPMEQALPELVREALTTRGRRLEVLAPVLSLDRPGALDQLATALATTAARLGCDRRRLARALDAASAAQHDHERALVDVGRRTLDYARSSGHPVVALCGQLHVLHDPAVNASIPRLVRENGTLALPMDCYPLPADAPALPRVHWADMRHALQTALAARARGDVYPLLLTSFGCGPSSFGEQVFAALMEGYPHTVLESDGHGGTAGFVTRVQAFLHAVRKHDRRPSRPSARRLGYLEPLPRRPLPRNGGGRVVTLAVGDKVGEVVAAAYRAHGVDAVAAGPTSAEVLASGRRDCTGKECLPYQLVWGAFRQAVEERTDDRPVSLLQVTGEGACRNCMFSIKDQLSLERLGLDDRVDVRHFGPESRLGPLFFARVHAGMISWDILNQLAAYHRGHARWPEEVDELYEDLTERLLRILARPARRLRPLPASLVEGHDLLRLMDRAASGFARIAARAVSDARLRTVLLSGDIYVRLDEFASDRLVRRLNERRLRVLVEPLSILSEYTGKVRLSDLFGLPTDRLGNFLSTSVMRATRARLYARVRPRHPWLPETRVDELLGHAHPLLDEHPLGEAPVTIGSVLWHWKRGDCDGVVVASPWGCGPALISESILRHQRHIPMLFVYADGSPIDERKLNAFAFRLQRRAVRTAAPDQTCRVS